MKHEVIPDVPALRVRDGLQLHWRDWLLQSPRGTVLLVHGLGEHVGRYEHVAERLNGWGWSVSGYDHRGHGRSPGQRGGLVRDDDLMHDLAFAIDRVRTRSPRTPLMVLGHSMGGLLVAKLGAGLCEPKETRPAWARSVDGLVLSSPALEAHLSLLDKLLLNSVAKMLPDVSQSNGIRLTHLSRDPQVVAAYKADPFVHDTITGRLARFLVEGGTQVLKHAPNWQIPTLLVYASHERVVNPRGASRFAQTTPSGVVSSLAFPKLAHEIFNEPEKDQVFEVLQGWLEGRLSALANKSPAINAA